MINAELQYYPKALKFSTIQYTLKSSFVLYQVRFIVVQILTV